MKLSSIDLSQRPNRREKLIFFISLVIFVAGFFKTCWTPSRSSIAELEEQIVYMENQKVQLSQDGVVNADTPSSSISHDTLKFASSMDDFNQFTKLASQPLLLKGVELKESHFSDIEVEGKIHRQEIKFTLKGSFRAVGNYINEIEKLTPPFVIESFSLQGGDNKLGKVTIDLVGSVYGHE